MLFVMSKTQVTSLLHAILRDALAVRGKPYSNQEEEGMLGIDFTNQIRWVDTYDSRASLQRYQ
jgi:hypothetical protein